MKLSLDVLTLEKIRKLFVNVILLWVAFMFVDTLGFLLFKNEMFVGNLGISFIYALVPGIVIWIKTIKMPKKTSALSDSFFMFIMSKNQFYL